MLRSLGERLPPRKAVRAVLYLAEFPQMKYSVTLAPWISIVAQAHNALCGVYVSRLGRIEGPSDFKMYSSVDTLVHRKSLPSVSLSPCLDFADNDLIACSSLYVNWRVSKNWNFCCHICALLVSRNG